MLEIIEDTLIDSIKLLPFLFLTFLLIEYLEHKVNSEKIIKKTGKFGPIFGSILGAFPQCGFSVSATNLYVTRIITLGTLMAVYLSTSDEMLPIMISEGVQIDLILKIICLKIIIGMIFGFIIDFFYKEKENNDVYEICEHDNCHCEEGIFKSSLNHTLQILFFILIVTFILNIVISYLGLENLKSIANDNSILSVLISGLIGLIPNCASSIVITELYLSNAIPFGTALAGLLTGSGIGILVLFKYNKNIKKNISILCLLYLIGIVSGFIVNMI